MTAHVDPLERELVDAAQAARWPATPDLAARVVARVGPGKPLTARPRTTPGGQGRLVRALALAALLLIVAAGAAVALGYRLPGLDIVFGDPVTAPPAGSGLRIGSPAPLGEVRATGQPRVLVPAALPVPDNAYVSGAGSDRIVTLAWRAREGEGILAGGGDLALVVMAVPGRAEEALLTKVLGPDTTIERVEVGGDRGWWIAGAPHELLYLDPDAEPEMLQSAVAGDTLVFARDGTLYRLESALGRERTLEVAASMR